MNNMEVGDDAHMKLNQGSVTANSTFNSDSNICNGKDTFPLSDGISSPEEPVVKGGTSEENQLVGDLADVAETEPVSADKSDDVDNDGWTLVLGHDQLKKRTLRPGEHNTRPVKGQQVTIKCIGHLEDGTEIDKHDSLKIILGDDDFIYAMDICIALMDVGELCEIWTEARFAYGEIGREPDVPPNAKVLYEVELLEVGDELEFHTLTVNYRLQLSDKKREHGNELYKRGEYSRAVDVYNKAAKIVDTDNEHIVETPEELKQLAEMRVKCCNNLAAAQLKLEAWDAAIKSCDTVLLLHPDNVKSLFRKGKCMAGKGSYDEAISILTRALKLEPDSKIILQELAHLRRINKEQNQSQKEMYQKMMGTDKQPFIQKPSVASKPRDTRWIWYVAGAVVSMIIPISFTVYRLIFNSDENSSINSSSSGLVGSPSSSEFLMSNASVAM